MAKRGNQIKPTTKDTTTTNASEATTADAMKLRVVAFAEELGRIAGTVQATSENWSENEILSEQIANVRDGAAKLLEQLKGAMTTGAKTKPTPVAVQRGRGRSGGVVDAPGKKHRKPVPNDSAATIARSQAAKMRIAKTAMKTNRPRGRG